MQAPTLRMGSFGGGASDTMMHPAVAVAMIAAIVAMLWLPRKYVIVPFLLGLFLLPVGQQVYLGGVHLYVPRILVLVGMGVLVGAKLRSKTRVLLGGWNDLDKIFTCWAIFRALAMVFLNWGDTSAMINQGAFLWDTLGGYYFLRYLIRDTEDIGRVAKTFAVIVGVLGVTMLIERFRNLNVFGYLGGVPIIPVFRDGNIRAQGPFEHPLLAGAFASTLLPFFIWLWHSKKARLLGILGVLGSGAMVFACASSTPVMSVVAVVFGICFWPLRGRMRTVRWVVLTLLIACHLVMKAPVWFLIARMDIIAGNSGYHRAELIDTFVRHFSDWWLTGTNKAATWGFDMDDLCEQWVAEGESGGLATFVCFILLISRCFGRIGKARKRSLNNPRQEWFLWLIGVALFSHCVGFFGISYFDQTRFAWYTLLAIISTVTITRTAGIPAPQAAVYDTHLEGAGEEMIPVGAFYR